MSSYAGSQRRGMINELYRSILGRHADPAGLDNYERSGLNETQIGDSLRTSEENRRAQVEQLYNRIHHRRSDEGGMQHFTNFIPGKSDPRSQDGFTPDELESLARNFRISPEHKEARERTMTYVDTRQPGDLAQNINTMGARARQLQADTESFQADLRDNARNAAQEIGSSGRAALARLDAAVKPPVYNDPFAPGAKIADDSLFAQMQRRIKGEPEPEVKVQNDQNDRIAALEKRLSERDANPYSGGGYYNGRNASDWT